MTSSRMSYETRVVKTTKGGRASDQCNKLLMTHRDAKVGVEMGMGQRLSITIG